MTLTISRRWIIFFIATSSFVLSQFYRVSIAIISPNLIKDLGLDTSGLSLISAAFFYAFAFMQIPVALYLDSIGPRISMTVLTLTAVAGSVVFATGESLTMLVVGRVLLGIGMACNLMGTLKLITLWFGPLRFGTLSALVLSVGTLGNIMATTPLVLVVANIGWRATFLILAGLNLIIALLFYFIVRDQPPESEVSNLAAKVPISLKETLSSIRSLFSMVDYWIISFGSFCRYGIFAAVQALWAGPYLMTVIKVSPIATGNLILMMNMGLVVGSPISGYLSDAILRSRKLPIGAGLFGMMGILIVLANLKPGTSSVLLAVLFFGFGFASSAGQVMMAHIKERMPIERAGTALTGVNFFTMIGVAFFLQMLGSVMQYLYPQSSLGAEAFRDAFYLCAGFLGLTVLLYLFTVETSKKLLRNRR
ncbi:MAG: MFS transporter [SAR324 cluster bacterium]|nr:MFS transporter [SAR324 cluster bacterium]